MNRKISIGMAVTIVILAMTVTFSITMLVAMRLFDSTVSSVKEKESMYNKIAEVDRYVRSNDYYTIDENTLYDRLTAGYLLAPATSTPATTTLPPTPSWSMCRTAPSWASAWSWVWTRPATPR